jgi:antitoxin HicB
MKGSRFLTFAYPVTLTADKVDGSYVVTCRDVPEVVTQGEAIEDAISEAEGALEAAIEMRIEDGLDIPAPSAKKRSEHLARVPINTAMKAAVYVSMREQNVSKAELAGRLGLDEKETRRMLDPKHGTKVPALERALHALGKRIELVVV